jgi:hypothetical protein
MNCRLDGVAAAYFGLLTIGDIYCALSLGCPNKCGVE